MKWNGYGKKSKIQRIKVGEKTKRNKNTYTGIAIIVQKPIKIRQNKKLYKRRKFD